MANQFSNSMVALALKLINQYGEQVTFNRTTRGTYDTTTGFTNGDSNLTYSSKVVSEYYSSKEVDGSRILEGDIKVYAPQMDQVPQPDDKITLADTSIYRVISVKLVKAVDETCLYTIQARK